MQIVSVIRRATVIGFGLLFLLMAIKILGDVLSHGVDWSLGFSVLALASVGVALLFNWFWVRRTLAAALLAIAVIAPLGVINPFAASDLWPNSSPITEIVGWLIGFTAALLLLAWLVDPSREEQPNKPLERPRGAAN